MDERIMRDLLAVCDPNLTARSQTDYCRGLIVGVVGALMTKGHTHHFSCKTINKYMPKRIYKGSIPESWEDYFTSEQI